MKVTRHCNAGLACGKSVAEVYFLGATQAYIRLPVHKALFGDWSPRTARSSDWGDMYLNLIGYTIAPLSPLVWKTFSSLIVAVIFAAQISLTGDHGLTVPIAQQRGNYAALWLGVGREEVTLRQHPDGGEEKRSITILATMAMNFVNWLGFSLLHVDAKM